MKHGNFSLSSIKLTKRFMQPIAKICGLTMSVFQGRLRKLSQKHEDS